MHRRLLILWSIVLAAIAWRVAVFAWGAETPEKSSADTNAVSPEGLKLFNDHVHAIFVAKCVKCHGGQKTEAGFSLSDREGLLKGGDQGIDVVPGKAGESPLVTFVKHEDEPHMPKDAPKLSVDEIAKIEAWINAGAPYSGSLATKAAPKGRATVTDADREFWSFMPLAEVQPPAVKNEPWCRTPIDRFILAKLEEKGIAPSAAADRRQLIRRAYFDLLGLPPSPEEMDAFV